VAVIVKKTAFSINNHQNSVNIVTEIQMTWRNSNMRLIHVPENFTNFYSGHGTPLKSFPYFSTLFLCKPSQPHQCSTRLSFPVAAFIITIVIIRTVHDVMNMLQGHSAQFCPTTAFIQQSSDNNLMWL